jgi:hypothetical protein
VADEADDVVRGRVRRGRDRTQVGPDVQPLRVLNLHRVHVISDGGVSPAGRIVRDDFPLWLDGRRRVLGTRSGHAAGGQLAGIRQRADHWWPSGSAKPRW